MTYVIAIVLFLIGNVVGIVFGMVYTYRPVVGKLKVEYDEDGAYCFLVFKDDPTKLKHGEILTLKVDNPPRK